MRGRYDVSRGTGRCARLGTGPSVTFCVADLFRGLLIALFSTGLLRVDARTPPLDSRVRENDETRGRNDEEGTRK